MLRIALVVAGLAAGNALGTSDDTSVVLNNGVIMPLVSVGVWVRTALIFCPRNNCLTACINAETNHQKYNGSQAQAACENAYAVGFRAFDTAYDCKWSLCVLLQRSRSISCL